MADGPRPTKDESLPLPRVTIKFCTQCKWMLRAAYFAQELLSTFSTSLGEVALQPGTGGVFVVEIFHHPPATPERAGDDPAALPAPPAAQRRVLWDRSVDGGFPETKELKRRVRDVIDPGRDLGHVDRHGGPKTAGNEAAQADSATAASPIILRMSSGAEEEQADVGVKDEERRGVEPPVQVCRISGPSGEKESGTVDEDQGKGQCEDCV